MRTNPAAFCRNLLILRTAAVALLGVTLFFGCDQGSDVRQTVPADGAQDVEPRTKIAMRFTTRFTDSDDTDAAFFSQEVTVVGDKSTEPYSGSFQIMPFSQALSPTANDDADSAGEDGSSGDTSERSDGDMDTLVFTLPPDEQFKDGEKITVFVSHDVTVGRIPIHSFDFSFTILTPPPSQADLGDLQIVSTDPDSFAVGRSPKPRISVSFSQAVRSNNLKGNISVEGDHSGVHADLEVLFTHQEASDRILEIAARLGSDETFLPGEWVQVTLNDNIQAALSETGDGDDSLRLSPYSFDFQVSPGSVDPGLDGGWSSTGGDSMVGRALVLVAVDLSQVFVGVEYAVLSDQRLEVHYQREPGQRAVRLVKEFGDGLRLVDLAAADLVGFDDFASDGTPELVLLLEGPSGSTVRFYNLQPEGEIEENLERAIDFPATGLKGMVLSDIDANGHRDLLVFHEPSIFTPSVTTDPLAGLEPVDTGTLTILAKRFSVPDLSQIDLSNPDSFVPRLHFEVIHNPIPDLDVPNRLEVADLDNDGKPDLMVESPFAISVYRNSGTRAEPHTFQFARFLRDVAGLRNFQPLTWGISDIDGDGDADFLAWDADGAWVLKNTVFADPDTGGGLESSPRGIIFENLDLSRLPALDLSGRAAAAARPTFGDLDGDGRLDVLLADSEADLWLFTGLDLSPPSDGSQGFEKFGDTLGLPSFESSLPGHPVGLAAADVDGDTGIDFILVTYLEDSVFQNDSYLEVFQTSGVVSPTIDSHQYSIFFCDGSPSVSSSVSGFDCTDASVSTFKDSIVRVPIVANINQDFSGYSINLSYDDSLLSFHDYEVPSNFSGQVTVLNCSVANNESCEGFVNLQVSFNTDSSTGGQLTGSPGARIPLGAVRFRAGEVAETVETSIYLSTSLDEEDSEQFGNFVFVPDGDDQAKLHSSVDDSPLFVSLLPSSVAIESCEVVDVREEDFTARITWRVSQTSGVTPVRFVVQASGRLFPIDDAEARSFEFDIEGAASLSVQLSAFDSSDNLIASDTCSDGITVDVLRPLVTCVSLGTANRIDWSIATPVDSVAIYKNGTLLERVAGNVTNIVDFNPSDTGGDLYGVEGERGGMAGPRGFCRDGPVGDPDPGSTLPPVSLALQVAERQTPDTDIALEFTWVNGEGYSTLEFELLKEGPTGMEVILQESFDGATTRFSYHGDRPGGVAPGNYQFRLTGIQAANRSPRAESGIAGVRLPDFGGISLICSRGDGNRVDLSWDDLWPGWSCLEVKAVNKSTGHLILAEFVAPSLTNHSLPDLPLADAYEFSLSGIYKEFLPEALAGQTASPTCTLVFSPRLRLATVETGVGLERNVLIPIRADSPARVSGFAFTVELPYFLEIDAANPQAAFILNSRMKLLEASGSSAQFVRFELLEGVGVVNPHRLSVEVSGGDFPAGEETVLGWIVATVDWTTHGFSLAGNHPLRFQGTGSLTFSGTETGDLPVTRNDVTGEDADAKLVVHKRYLVIDTLENVTATSNTPVTVRVRGTFDEPVVGSQTKDGYRLLAYTVHLKFDAEALQLETVLLSDQEETVIHDKGFLDLPDEEDLEEARQTGEVTITWLGIELTASPDDDGSSLSYIGSGINQNFLVLRFLPKLRSNAIGKLAEISFVTTPDDNPSSVLPTRRPSDGFPIVSFFDGGVDILTKPNRPALVASEPDHGPMGGGGVVAVEGMNFDSEVVTIDDIRVSLERTQPPITVEIPSANFSRATATLLRFELPPLPPESIDPAVDSLRFDLGVETPAGKSILKDAYQYENLSLRSTNLSSGSASGGEKMLVRGTGLGKNSQITFRFDDGTGPVEFPVSEVLGADPEGRWLEFLTPPMPVEGDQLGTVVVTVGDLGSRELPVPFHVVSSAAVKSVTPDRGILAGGQTVTVEVVGFESLPPDDTSVYFDDQQATIAGIDEGRYIRVTTPAIEMPGNTDVRVVSGGEMAVGRDLFTYLPPTEPTIHSLAPAEGPLEGGNLVSIRHSGFDLENAEFQVEVGDVGVLDVAEVQPGVLEVTMPGGQTRGPVPVTLRRGILAATLPDAYRYLEPRIALVEPLIGSTRGGALVTVELEDFGTLSGPPTVRIGQEEAKVESFQQDGQDLVTIIVVAPPHCQPGPVEVAVEHGDLSAVAPGAFNYEKDEALSINAVTFSGCVAVDVAVTGTGFCRDTPVFFNDIAIDSLEFVDDHTLRFAVPDSQAGVTEVTIVLGRDVESVEWQGTLVLTASFIRGDADGNGDVNVSDVVALSRFLSAQEGDFKNFDALDVTDNGVIDGGDLVRLTAYVFNGGQPPAPPFPDAGPDPTADSLPDCVQ